MLTGSNLKRDLCIVSAAIGLVAWAVHAHDRNVSAAAVKNLTAVPAVANPTLSISPSNAISLSWTVVEQDENDPASGPADRYDIRYSSDGLITEQNWDAAFQVRVEPTPLAQGTVQSYDITGLSQQTTYYVAMKLRDAANNWSGLSNVAKAATALAVSGDWVFDVVATEGSPGFHNALAYDPVTGHPAIAFENYVNHQLHFTSWNDTTEQWDVPVVLGPLSRGMDLAFVPGSSTPTIAFVSQGSLKFAGRNDSTLRWDIEIIQEREVTNWNRFISLAYDHVGDPAVAYYSNTVRGAEGHPTGLRLARRNGTAWTIQLVDEEANWGSKSLAFDLSGKPAIAYQYNDGTADMLKFAHWNGTDWDIEIVDPDESTGLWADLAYDPTTGFPAIANQRLNPSGVRFVRWDGNEWQAETVEESTSACGRGISLVYDGGTAIVSYLKYGNSVRLARRVVGVWHPPEIIRSNVEPSGHTSLAIDPLTGAPSLSYCHWSADRVLTFARKQQ